MWKTYGLERHVKHPDDFGPSDGSSSDGGRWPRRVANGCDSQYQAQHRRQEERRKAPRLRPADIGQYDGTTRSARFCKRLRILARRYGEDDIIDTAFVCLNGKAATWLDTLPEESQEDMGAGLNSFCFYLTDRSNINASETIERADKMEHSFANESEYDVREYITLNLGLYHEAGEENEDLIVRRIHRKLDPYLRALVQLDRYDNTIADFQDRVYSAEQDARDHYKQFNGRISQQEKELEEMRRQPSSRSARQNLGEMGRQDINRMLPKVARPFETPKKGPQQLPSIGFQAAAQKWVPDSCGSSG